MKLPAPFQGMKSLKALVVRGEEIAKTQGDSSLGAEHLLAAALEEPGGSARRAFERAGVDPDAYLTAIGDAHDAALRGLGLEPVDPTRLGAGTRGSLRLNESTAHVLRSAAGRSRVNRPQLLGAQIVAAVSELEHGTAARALRQLGVDRAELAVAADAELQASSS